MSELKKRLAGMEETLRQAVNTWHASGELKSFHGKPLDLSDQSPEWFANRLLKREGYSHPTIERRREVEASATASEAIADRLRSLTLSATRSKNGQFNRVRRELLAAYAEELRAANRRISAFNLSVPDGLHIPLRSVEDAVARLERQVPEDPWGDEDAAGA